MFCGKPEAVKHFQKEGNDLELLWGQKGGGQMRRRKIQADGERGTQGSWGASFGEPTATWLPLRDWAKSWLGTRRGKKENTHFHMCANVLSGTVPGTLLIRYPASPLSKSVQVPHSASLTNLWPSIDQTTVCLHDYVRLTCIIWVSKTPFCLRFTFCTIVHLYIYTSKANNDHNNGEPCGQFSSVADG